MSKSALLKILGNGPTGKLLEHLLMGREFDYTVADIHEGTRLSRLTIEKKLKEMIEDKIVNKTRKIGKSQLYKINLKDYRVQALLQLLEAVIEKQEEKISEAAKEEKTEQQLKEHSSLTEKK